MLLASCFVIFMNRGNEKCCELEGCRNGILIDNVVCRCKLSSKEDHDMMFFLADCSPQRVGWGLGIQQTTNGDRGEEERQETTKGESGTDFLREGEYVSRDRKSVRQEPEC
jgi:hypothetical protein